LPPMNGSRVYMPSDDFEPGLALELLCMEAPNTIAAVFQV